MPISSADKEGQLPIRGLNTEANKLQFPIDEGFCQDIKNFLVDFDPLHLRVRLGHSDNGFEKSGATDPIDKDYSGLLDTSTLATSFYLWERADSSDNHFLVVQSGSKIGFVIVTASGIGDVHSTTDITPAAGNSQDEVDRSLLQFATAKGNLIMVSETIDPILIRYDAGSDTISANTLTLKIRDTLGLESGIEVDQRPTVIGDFPVGATASATYTNISEAHEYNLYNQGWYQNRKIVAAGAFVDPIAEFNTINSEYPSNADIVYIGMVESSGDLIFDADWLKQQTFGSSPAPRGHYIVDAFNIDRNTILSNPDQSGGTTGGGSTSGGGFDEDWGDFPNVIP